MFPEAFLPRTGDLGLTGALESKVAFEHETGLEGETWFSRFSDSGPALFLLLVLVTLVVTAIGLFVDPFLSEALVLLACSALGSFLAGTVVVLLPDFVKTVLGLGTDGEFDLELFFDVKNLKDLTVLFAVDLRWSAW